MDAGGLAPARKRVVTVQQPVTLDAAVPLVQRPRDLNKVGSALRADGVDALLATVSSVEDLPTTLSNFGAWQDRGPAAQRPLHRSRHLAHRGGIQPGCHQAVRAAGHRQPQQRPRGV